MRFPPVSHAHCAILATIKMLAEEASTVRMFYSDNIDGPKFLWRNTVVAKLPSAQKFSNANVSWCEYSQQTCTVVGHNYC